MISELLVERFARCSEQKSSVSKDDLNSSLRNIEVTVMSLLVMTSWNVFMPRLTMS